VSGYFQNRCPASSRIYSADNFKEVDIDGSILKFYRDRKIIWGQERTVVIFISSKLKAGRIRGIYQSIKKIEKSLKELKISLINPGAKKRDRDSLEEKIAGMVKGQYVKNIINWELEEISDGRFMLKFYTN